MNEPSHEEIARKAYELWQQRGNLRGTDTEIWFEAERQLKEGAAPASEGRQSKGEAGQRPAQPGRPAPKAESQAGAVLSAPLSPAPPAGHDSGLTEQQKAAGRAPQLPHHTGPKSKPAETGKPVWSKPHGA